MHEVFISYSSKDKNIADAVCHSLEEHGITCWIAPRDVQPGIPYAREIIKGIKECKIMVLIFTSNSNISEHVCNEIDKAFNNNKIIVPFLVEEISMDEALEYYLSRKHWLVAYPYYEKHLNELADAVGKALGREIIIKKKAPEPKKRKTAAPKNDTANLKILTDTDCKVLIDCEEKAVAYAGSLLKLPLQPGEYYAEFVSITNETDKITAEITIERDTLHKVNLSALQKKREEEEKKEEEEKSKETRLTPYIQNKKIGFVDEETMQIVIPCKYDYAYSFSEELALVKLKGKYGFIDKNGKEVIPCKYNEADSFDEGLARVELNGKYGFIDKNGKEVIPCKYDDAYSFSEGLARVELNGKYGFIDKNGKEVIPCKYFEADPFSEGLASVGLNGKWGFIDKNGKEVIPCKYNEADSFDEGLARVSLDETLEYGFIDKKGKEVILCKYVFVSPFHEGLAIVSSFNDDDDCDEYKEVYGFIDKNWKEVIPCKYDDTDSFSEGLARVELNGKHGFIDKNGKEVIPCKYDYADSFHVGLARVKQNGKHGFIDKNGKEVIPCKYNEADHFYYGLARVKLNRKSGYIDKFGNCTLD